MVELMWRSGGWRRNKTWSWWSYCKILSARCVPDGVQSVSESVSEAEQQSMRGSLRNFILSRQPMSAAKRASRRRREEEGSQCTRSHHHVGNGAGTNPGYFQRCHVTKDFYWNTSGVIEYKCTLLEYFHFYFLFIFYLNSEGNIEAHFLFISNYFMALFSNMTC